MSFRCKRSPPCQIIQPRVTPYIAIRGAKSIYVAQTKAALQKTAQTAKPLYRCVLNCQRPERDIYPQILRTCVNTIIEIFMCVFVGYQFAYLRDGSITCWKSRAISGRVHGAQHLARMHVAECTLRKLPLETQLQASYCRSWVSLTG